MKTDRFARDIMRNTCVSRMRKKRWVLYFLRKEQEGRSRASRKMWALCKKVVLAGTGCELPAESFVGGYSLTSP